MNEDPNRPDSVIAKEYWDGFRARNSSIIVDLLYGQLKSTVTCLTCGRIANAFDPYLSVCLPIMKEEKMEFNFVSEVTHDRIEEDGEEDFEARPFKVFEYAVNKSKRISDIKVKVLEDMNLPGVSPDDLIVANQRQG